MTGDDLGRALDRTWPPARTFPAGIWTIREGRGGGKRVSAATAATVATPDDIAVLEAAMAGIGQPPLVMVRPGEDELDAALDKAGYGIVDPVVAYAAPVGDLAVPPPPVSAFVHWPRLAVAESLWAAAGIGPGRLAVMDRTGGPKAAILARTDDQPAGAAFAAVDGDTAMIHAIEVVPALRRRGAARNMIRAAACWAQGHCATRLALVVTRHNAAARALYASLGMAAVGQYHYRLKGAAEGISP
jgi:GNAT superfamily N-acetyltransferase